VKTEFGFDVLEIARERYAPDSYHDFIGFEVSRPVLEQAFRETYGLELKDVLVSEDKVLNSYRRDVSKLIRKPLESPGISRKTKSRTTFRTQQGESSVQSVPFKL